LKNRTILVVGILIIILISMILLIPSKIPSIIDYLFLATVPSNPNFSISSGLEPKSVIQADVGGTDYSEIFFEKSQDRGRWLVPCFGAIRIEAAECVCDGFAKGYLRKYSTYTLQDGTVVKSNHTHPLSVKVNNHKGNTKGYELENYSDLLSIKVSNEGNSARYFYKYEDDHTVMRVRKEASKEFPKLYFLEYEDKEELEGNYTLFIHVIEYNTSYNARSACSFLTIDANYPKILINDVKVIGMEFHGTAHYVLPSDNFLISIRGNSYAVRDAMSKVIELHKRQ